MVTAAASLFPKQQAEIRTPTPKCLFVICEKTVMAMVTPNALLLAHIDTKSCEVKQIFLLFLKVAFNYFLENTLVRIWELVFGLQPRTKKNQDFDQFFNAIFHAISLLN